MAATVSYKEEEGVISVIESGTVTKSDFEAAVETIVRLIGETGCSRVLVDARQQQSHTDGLDAYDRAVHASRRLRDSGTRLGILVGEHLVKGHQFFETVSRNRGLLARVFDDEDAVRRWLRS